MNRIDACFSGLARSGRTGLIPYVTAGDPAPEYTVSILHRLVASGADLLELGVPFSDPMADGPVIQHAHERALSHHTNLHRVFSLVEEFRREDLRTPVVLMGYLNPVEAMGHECFAERAAQAGIDGVLWVDLPPEESEGYNTTLRDHGLDQIFLLSPTTSKARAEHIAAMASGYVYYISLKGVTGSNALDISAMAQHLHHISEHICLPVSVGFGIRTAEEAVAVGRDCDAVVIGSSLVERIARFADDEQALLHSVGDYMCTMRTALDTELVGV